MGTTLEIRVKLETAKWNAEVAFSDIRDKGELNKITVPSKVQVEALLRAYGLVVGQIRR